MRALPLLTTLAVLAALTIAAAVPALGVPQVAFSTASMNITASSTLRTPPIVVQNASGVSAVEVSVVIPADIAVNTAASGTGLVCVKKGSSAGGLYFAEWDAGARTINISCDVTAGPTLQIAEYIEFTTPASLQVEEMDLSGTVTGGTGTATFGSLSLLPPHQVQVAAGPTTSPGTVDSGGTTNCSISATDSHGHALTYAWSSAGAGSFSSASAQNPVYTAPSNRTDANTTVTLTCVVACSQVPSVSVTRTVSVTVKPHKITLTGPTVQHSSLASGATTNCSVTAVDSMSHAVSYAWSDGGAGGSFSNAAIANPVYTAPSNATETDRTVTLTCTVTCTQDPQVKKTGTVALTVQPHKVTFGTAPAVNPVMVGTNGQTSCSAAAQCSNPAHSVTYAWTSGGAGSFSSASAQNPTYTAPTNNTGHNTTVTLTCTAKCAEEDTIVAVATVRLIVSPKPPKTVTVTSESASGPITGVSIAFAPTPDAASVASPKPTPVTLNYLEATSGVALTAPVTDGTAHPRWFVRWKLDAADQTAGQRTCTLNVGTANRAAVAVYGALVGDIDSNGSVEKTDADLVLQAVLGDIAKTALMDVNQDGAKDANGNVTTPNVDLKDARWILQHLYAEAGG